MAAELGRILVTGANGQIGRRLIQQLARDDPPRGTVRAVVRSERAAETLRGLPEPSRTDPVVLDYGSADQLARAAAGCRFAVHLVGIIKESSTSRYTEAHEEATAALAAAAASAGLRRIVYLSVLGSDPASPNACLASKGRAEQILVEADTPAVILRVPMVLGPGDSTSRVVRAEALARLLPLVGGGVQKAQPIYVDDVVEAILSALTRPSLDDHCIDLAGPESLPAREMIRRAAALYGRKPRVIPVPVWLAEALAFAAERLMSDPPITRAMLGVIACDDDVDVAPACQKLGLELTPLDETLRLCVGPEAGSA